MSPSSNNRPPRPIVAEKSRALNSLRLDDRVLNAVLNKLDDGAGVSGESKRTYVRWPFRHASIDVTMIHPGGSRAAVPMACRNLSCGGIGLLHSAYAHPGTPVELRLPHPFRGSVPVSGTITCCRHRGGLLHEIGVKFDRAINVRDFVRPDPFREYFSLEKVDPSQLRGTIVYAEDSILDQRIVRHYLRDTSLTLRTAETADAAIALVKQGADLIISDFHLPDRDGSQFVRDVRDAGVAAPVIMVTSDNSSATRARVRDCSADSFLAKPLSQERLLRAVAEFMLVANQSGVSGSTLTPDDQMYDLVAGFVDQLHELAGKLAGCLNDDKASEAFAICQQIRGTAPTLGFEPLGKLAGQTAEIVARTGSAKESARQVQELISACQRAAA